MFGLLCVMDYNPVIKEAYVWASRKPICVLQTLWMFLSILLVEISADVGSTRKCATNNRVATIMCYITIG